jgi:hypothetical protein
VHFFARPEHWHLFLNHPDFSPASWISANAACSILYGKCAKAPQLEAQGDMAMARRDEPDE